MLIARRPLGKALFARSRIYELVENGKLIGSIEHGAARDVVDIEDRRFFIVAQRKQSLFESIVKTLMRLFKEVIRLQGRIGDDPRERGKERGQ